MSGSELLQLRRRLGLTQVALAAALGTCQGHIADMEHGRRSISPQIEARLQELARVPGVCMTCLCPLGSGLPCGCRDLQP